MIFIYYLLDPRNGRIPQEGEHVYVGVTCSLGRRMKEHTEHLYKTLEEDHNSYLGNWMRKLWEDDIFVDLSVRCVVETEEEAFRIEQILIETLKDRGVRATNMSKGGDGGWPSWLGKHHTEISRQKISKSNTGKRHTLESRAKMSKARLGKILSLSHRLNIGKGIKGRKISQKLRDIIIARNKSKKGQYLSAETCEKMWIAAISRGANPPSWKGKKHSSLTKEKIRNSWKLRKDPTPEYLQKQVLKAKIKADRLQLQLEKENAN